MQKKSRPLCLDCDPYTFLSSKLYPCFLSLPLSLKKFFLKIYLGSARSLLLHVAFLHSLVVVCRLLTAVVSAVAEHGL